MYLSATQKYNMISATDQQEGQEKLKIRHNFLRFTQSIAHQIIMLQNLHPKGTYFSVASSARSPVARRTGVVWV
jgi:hypothetical protein